MKLLVKYYADNRQVGHTHLMLHGAAGDRNCTIIAASQHEADMIKMLAPGAEVMALRGLNLTETRKAIAWDNHAIWALMQDAICEIEELRAVISQQRES